jgi:hypothetical protein
VALFSGLRSPVAQPEPDFYFVGRERVTLTPSSTYVALRIAPGASMESFEALSNDVDAAGGEVLSSPLLERYGLVLVRKKEDVGPSSFAESMRTFSTTTPNLAGESPVYVIDGVEHALTEKFITQFRAGTDEATIA